MNISPPLTMAATLRASTKGLKEVDQARRKKGWTKSEKAWAGLALTSVSTLGRFWAGLAIQSETFQEICQAVGIIDWESIADFETIDESSAKVYTKRLCFAIAGSIEDIDKNKLDVIVALLQKLGGDTSIEILDINEGSIKLILGGSPEGLEKIDSLFKSGELTDVAGSSVQDIHFLVKEELILLIKKNGGTALNLSRVTLFGADLHGVTLSGADLYGADLYGTNLNGADLSSTNLIEAELRQTDLRNADLRKAFLRNANLRGADLQRANLVRADLSGADLSRADLSQADLSQADLSEAILRETILSGARFGNNLGLSELDKSDMQSRGAIFQDSPDSDVPSFVRR
jgi:uncharacterized protein YjbI with pentapeptide repeats